MKMVNLKLDDMNDISIREQIIAEKIYLIRGKNVMLDADLAALYEVENKQLKRQVRRNIERFPDDFMFELTPEEVSRCQIGSLKQGGNAKYAPMAFTEQGVAMLSSVLGSTRAIHINIQIIRIFTKMRQLILDHHDLWLEIEKIKGKLDNQDKNMEIVFRYFDELLEAKQAVQPRKRIGFKSDEL
jgi:hypothetical protein